MYTRRVDASATEIWASLIEPTRVSGWLGTWKQEPDSPVLSLYFTFEGPDVLPLECAVVEREVARRLTLDMRGPGEDAEPVRVELELRTSGLLTELTVQHAMVDPAHAPYAASGCEFYLDRLVAQLEGRDPASLDYDDYFVGQAAHYRALFPVQRLAGAVS